MKGLYVDRFAARVLRDVLIVLIVTFFCETQVLCECGMRGPPGGLAGSGLLEHTVDLLESEALGLGYEEVRVDERASAETTPDEEDGRPEVALVWADHVRGDDGDDGVPQPVGGGGQSDTTGTDRKGEDFSDKDPSTWSPGGSKEEDEDGDECDLSVDCGDVDCDGLTGSVGCELVETNGDTDDGDEELADEHAESTKDQERTTTEPLDGPEGDRS